MIEVTRCRLGSQGLYEVMKTDSYIVSPDGDFTGVCWADQLPNALWSVERGFVAMPDEDVISRYRRADYTEEIFEIMRKAREAGWFYVYGERAYKRCQALVAGMWVILQRCRWNLVLFVILEGRYEC